MINKKRRYLVVTIMSVLISFMIISCLLKDIVVTTISKSQINNIVSQRVIDTIFDETNGYNTNQLLQLQDSINNSSSLYSLNALYVDACVDRIISGNDDEVNASKYFDEFYVDCVSKANDILELGLTSDYQDELVTHIKDSVVLDTLYDNFVDSMYDLTTNNVMIILYLYQILTSFITKIIIVLMMILSIVCFYRFHDSKNYFINDISKSCLISGGILLSVITLINHFSYPITQRILGMASSIYIDKLYNYSLIILIIGCLGTIGTYYYMHKYWNDEY